MTPPTAPSARARAFARPAAAVRRWRRTAIAATLCALGAASPAIAEPDSGYQFRFYLGGLVIGKARVAVEIADDAYRATTSARTDGVVDWFYEAEMIGETVGARDERARVTPATFTLRSVTEGERHDMRIGYAADRPASLSSEPPFEPKSYAIDPAEQVGALDPLSAIVAALTPASIETVCERVFPVFDGRRRYDIVLDGVVGDEVVDGERRLDCAARFHRVGGFKPKHLALPDVGFTVRFALLDDGRSLPIRAWADTDYGTAIGVLER